MNTLLSGEGLLWYDISVTFLILTAALAQFWAFVEHPNANRYYKVGRLMVGLGFLMWGLRFFTEIFVLNGDPRISIPGLISVTLSSSGLMLIGFLGKMKA